MIRTKLILIFFVMTNLSSAQNLDSLYNVFYKSLNPLLNQQTVQTGESETQKCGLFFVQTFRENFDKLSLKQQNEIASVLSRPETQKSIVTPSGFFRIHYDTTGINQILYNVNELAAALDSSYNYEVNILGYPAPPSDGSEGGDGLYDIYVQDLGSIYGWTDSPASAYSPSYIQIDNDFAVQYTTGIDGAKVTVAHEFHHAIQFGSYVYKSEDSFYYELLSTSMEEFVYDSINDYYDYIRSYYNNTQKSLNKTNGGGYDLAIWNIFLRDKYGYGVIKRGLENIINTSALDAIASSISEYGGSFKEDFSQFAIWNYFTGSRAKVGEYFAEASAYPLVKPQITFDFTTASKSVTVNSDPSSTNFIRFVDVSRSLPDTLVAIITNSDYNSQSSREFEYTLYNYEVDGATKVNDFYYSKLTALYKNYFTESAIFNNELAIEGKTERLDVDYSFPQPFEYKKHSTVFIPTGKDVSGKAYLNVYTIAMDLVFSGEKDIFATDKIVVRWDGKTNSGEELPTGIYVYVTKAGDTVKKGKIVIYNE